MPELPVRGETPEPEPLPPAGGTVAEVGDPTLAPPPNATLDYQPRLAAPPAADPATTGTVDYEPAGRAGADTNPEEAADTCTPRLPGPARPEVVAGHEVLGVLGRGAMGVVYKARQRGLNRLVALKMILAGPHAGERELARFKVEAEAVARLQHPGIVQIHEVGEEDGRPYFSLEYVEGGSLAKKIDATPQPPRAAAETALALAEAMDYAHQRGIVHRDLKPANVLLTADGRPKITDFGLAKKLEEDDGQTRTGTILGTPSYMAPEQALGQGREVGPLADVYALGAVLYELLTGRPPFKAATVLETLQQVRTQEPVPPTQLQPKVPRDLETVCLKCLRKEPPLRYAGAGALAEDLRRFLDGRPTLARPVGTPERLWRWCRRNPRVALLSSTVAALVVVWAVTSSALAWRLNVEQQQTERARLQADANAARAEKNAVVARQQHGVAIDRVLRLGEGLQKKLRSRRLSPQAEPRLKDLREDMLELLRQNMLDMSKELEAADVTSFAAASSHQKLGDLLARLGKGEEALRQYRQGHALVKKVAEEQPERDLARANLAVMLMRLGDMTLEVHGDARAARDSCRQARDLLEAIATQPRDHYYTENDLKRLRADADMHLGRAYLTLGDPAAARQAFAEARTFRQAWVDAEPENVSARSWLTETYLWLGTAAWHRDDVKAARDNLDRGLRLVGALAADYPRDFSFRGDLATYHGAYADLELCLGEAAAARTHGEEALKQLKAVLAHDPDNLSEEPLLAQTYERLAAAALRQGNRAEAATDFQEALKLRAELVQVDPNDLAAQTAYLVTLAHCGKVAEAARGAEQLRARVGRGTEPLLRLARCQALCAAATPDAAARQKSVTQALEALQAATKEDYTDAVALRTDPDLDPLRREPAYQAVLDRLVGR